VSFYLHVCTFIVLLYNAIEYVDINRRLIKKKTVSVSVLCINVSTELEMTVDARHKSGKPRCVKHCKCALPVIHIQSSDLPK